MANDSNGKLSPTKVETIHLRVYVHCEGCKKKVNKILTKIEGVQTVDIDASLGKVTVTGTADAKTVIRKLEKSGKVVELWPAPAPQPIKLALPTHQPKEDSKEKDSKEKAKDKEEKKGQPRPQPQPSPQKPVPDSSTKQINANENSSKGKAEGPADKKKQGTDQHAAPSDEYGSKSASKKSSSGVADNVSKSVENNNKAKPMEANGDAKHSNGGAVSSSNNSNKKTDDGGGTPNANSKNTKSSDIASELEGEKVTSPDSKKSGDVEKDSNSSSKKKAGGGGGGGGGGGKSESLEINLEHHFVEASTSRSTANRHMAPPPMVLVETSEYSVDMESAEDYATHMFSDENANNCTLM